MTRMAATLAIVLSCAPHAWGQPPAPAAVPPPADAGQVPEWSFSASVFTYLLPDDTDYAQPSVTADRGWLHLEARYNYEGLETGSLWVGYNFGGGEAVEWELTPMLAGVFGATAGIAPGYRASLTWRWLDLYSEGEYVVDTGDSSESFFFNWSELSIVPVEWFRCGLATQRTRAYESDRDLQRGVLVGFSYKDLEGTVYVLNPDESTPTVIVAVAVGF